MNLRNDSSRRNDATLRCRAKNPADLLKTFVDWGLRNKRLTQKNLLAKDTRADTNVAHEIHSNFCDPDSERFFRPCNGLPFRRISGECAGFA
jgi:DNA-directed RNA polymerase